jgi:hypothetical protein
MISGFASDKVENVRRSACPCPIETTGKPSVYQWKKHRLLIGTVAAIIKEIRKPRAFFLNSFHKAHTSGI